MEVHFRIINAIIDGQWQTWIYFPLDFGVALFKGITLLLLYFLKKKLLRMKIKIEYKARLCPWLYLFFLLKRKTDLIQLIRST